MKQYSQLGLFLALGLIISSAIVAFNYKAAKKIEKQNEQTIKVKGYAELNITSDLATWSGSFNRRAISLDIAYEKLEKDKNIVKEYLVSEGFDAEKITFSSINTSTLYKKLNDSYKNSNEIDGYILSQTVSVKSKNLNLISKVSKESTSLIIKGVKFYSTSPQYFYTKINDLKIEMLAKAAQNAKLRAEQLAINTGSKVGGLTYASQGVFQITSANSTEVSDYGNYDTYSKEKTIKAVVTVEFSIR